MPNGSLMKVESIAECSPWSILQYFRLALSGNWSLENQFFCLFESGCLHRFYRMLLYKNEQDHYLLEKMVRHYLVFTLDILIFIKSI